jgi:hypothetical protein
VFFLNHVTIEVKQVDLCIDRASGLHLLQWLEGTVESGQPEVYQLIETSSRQPAHLVGLYDGLSMREL